MKSKVFADTRNRTCDSKQVFTPTWRSQYVTAWRNLVCATFLGLVGGGCMIPTYGVYVGCYNVVTKNAEAEEFRPVMNEVCDDIVSGLGKEYAVLSRRQGKTGVGVDVRHTTLSPDASHPLIGVNWYVGQRRFSITITKHGSDVTPEVVQIRHVVEEVLRKHPTFKWEYEVSHSYIDM